MKKTIVKYKNFYIGIIVLGPTYIVSVKGTRERVLGVTIGVLLKRFSYSKPNISAGLFLGCVENFLNLLDSSKLLTGLELSGFFIIK